MWEWLWAIRETTALLRMVMQHPLLSGVPNVLLESRIQSPIVGCGQDRVMSSRQPIVPSKQHDGMTEWNRLVPPPSSNSPSTLLR